MNFFVGLIMLAWTYINVTLIGEAFEEGFADKEWDALKACVKRMQDDSLRLARVFWR